jgi:hypothetical protein
VSTTAWSPTRCGVPCVRSIIQIDLVLCSRWCEPPKYPFTERFPFHPGRTSTLTGNTGTGWRMILPHVVSFSYRHCRSSESPHSIILLSECKEESLPWAGRLLLYSCLGPGGGLSKTNSVSSVQPMLYVTSISASIQNGRNGPSFQAFER